MYGSNRTLIIWYTWNYLIVYKQVINVKLNNQYYVAEFGQMKFLLFDSNT